MTFPDVTNSCLVSVLICLLFCSAFNERTNAYKNAAFDILFDHEASQGQIFADCGVPNLVKQVVEVSNPPPKYL